MAPELPQDLLSVHEIASLRLSDRLEKRGLLYRTELDELVLPWNEDRHHQTILQQLPLFIEDDLAGYYRARRDSHAEMLIRKEHHRPATARSSPCGRGSSRAR